MTKRITDNLQNTLNSHSADHQSKGTRTNKMQCQGSLSHWQTVLQRQYHVGWQFELKSILNDRIRIQTMQDKLTRIPNRYNAEVDKQT